MPAEPEVVEDWLVLILVALDSYGMTYNQLPACNMDGFKVGHLSAMMYGARLIKVIVCSGK
jgi:hypothetical protein